MTNVTTPSVVRQIESLFDGGSAAGLTDRQLIERFVARRDPTAEAAFAALVARHGPMVLVVCRQLLGDRHHAEDAFQAVFLVLARKAASIGDPDRLGPWLYGVALRTARKARTRLTRQRRKEEGEAVDGPGAESIEPMAPPADQPAIDREQAEALHDEIDRLPSSFRLPVVLCYFEGLTLDEAAHRLSWRTGTLRSRLARARDKLRRGLTRRGVVLPGAALAGVLDSRAASASVSSPLCDITTRAAWNFAGGPASASSTAALAQEVLRTMLIQKLKFTATTLLLLATIATGAGYLTRGLAMKDEPRPQPAAPRPQVAAKPDDAIPHPAPGRMFVVGRVLDPQGRPVPNASVMVYARSTVPRLGVGIERAYPSEIGRATSDGSGRFRIDALRTSSTSHDQFGAVALAAGYGAGWVELKPGADRPIADIALRPEQVIQGRLFDVQGQPARGVKLSVTAIRRALDERSNATPGENFEGPAFWWAHPDDLPGWPGPVTTGDDGRFALHGVGSGLRVSLMVLDPRFSNQNLDLDTDAASDAKMLTMALQPARIISGRVTYADTGKPVSHARVSVTGFDQARPVFEPRPFLSETDAEGRFRSNAAPGDTVIVNVRPPERQPYLPAHKSIDWPKGAITQTVALALPRSAVIRGKVTEQGTDQPVPGAMVGYLVPLKPDEGIPARSIPAVTAADGSFEIAAAPRPGHLVVRSATDDHVLREMGNYRLYAGGSGGQREYAHAFVACDPKPGGESLDVHVVLRRGVTVRGRVIGPDGRPVQDVWMISRLHLGERPAAMARRWSGDLHGTARDGRFEIRGLDADAEVLVHFLDPRHKLGATVRFSGKSAIGGPITVRLEPCGTATARLVGPDGKPVAGPAQPRLFGMVVTPGASGATAQEAGALSADYGWLVKIDPINYRTGHTSDPQGRVVFPALIPGATYSVVDPTFRGPSGFPIRKEFTVKPGEALDLGEIRIEKPPAP